VARLIWNQEGQNRYEFGVDHGVFYTPDNLGYVWNGLVSVAEAADGGETTAYHFDGIKYLDVITFRNYKATISAFSIPSYFASAVGEQAVIPGFVLTRQTRSRFGLSYRTGIGNPTGYKIHLVYNVLASPSQQDYSTISDLADPMLRVWSLDAVPVGGLTYRPSAHYILDSSKMNPEVLEAVEDIIYGTDIESARLPSIDELIDFVTDTRLVKSPIDGLYRLE